MTQWLLVFLGGGLGSLTRYLAGVALFTRFPMQFPLATFTINVSGSFLIGLAMVLLNARYAAHPNWRLLLVVGFLGGYTTFSSFEWETLTLTRTGHPLLGIAYVAASVVAGYLAVWLGATLARR